MLAAHPRACMPSLLLRIHKVGSYVTGARGRGRGGGPPPIFMTRYEYDTSIMHARKQSFDV